MGPPPHGVPIQQAVGQLGGQLRGEVRQVLGGGDQTRGVVDLDLQVGQGVQEGRVGHGDLVGHVVQGVDGAAVHGRSVGQVRGSGQQVSWGSEVSDDWIIRFVKFQIYI